MPKLNLKPGKQNTITAMLTALLTLLLCIVLCACDSKPDSATEQAWQNSFREALLDGYSNFKGHFVDSDVAIYIFSYQLPAPLEHKKLFSLLRARMGAYTAVTESDNELVLRRMGTLKGYEIFDEYRILVNARQKIITIMFASLDSPGEMKNHQYFIDKLQKIHRALSNPSQK